MQVDTQSTEFKTFMKSRGWRFGRVTRGAVRKSMWYLPLGGTRRVYQDSPEWDNVVTVYGQMKLLVVGAVVQMNTPSKPHLHTQLAVVEEFDPDTSQWVTLVTGYRGKITRSKVLAEDLLFVGNLVLEQKLSAPVEPGKLRGYEQPAISRGG